MLLAGFTANHIFYVRTLLSQRVLIPDVLPSGILIRNGIDTAVVVSISTLVDGSFLAQSALPNNWIEGDVVHLRITAISSGLDLTQTIGLGEIGVSGSAIASAVRTNLTVELARIDVAVSSVSGGFNNSDRVALLSAQSAALATADGRQRINYLLSTFTQYNLDGSVRRVFNLTDENNSPATSGQTAIERTPQ